VDELGGQDLTSRPS
jgi:hypothetical protein